MSRLVLITGTSSGIGLHTALACAGAGFRVVATMRNLERDEALVAAGEQHGVAIELEQLDVTAPDVEDKVRELVMKYGPFYGLVNNAGIAIGGVFEELSDRDVREQFETNVFGLMAVTRALLPSMRASGAGRIVNVSSINGRLGLPGLSIYAATKHAVEGFSEGLRLEVEPFGVFVCLVEPGTVKTPIFYDNQRRGEATDPEGPYARMSDRIEGSIMHGAERAPPPDEVARTITELLSGRAPPFRTIVGRDARALVALHSVVPDRIFASGVRRILGL